jgi:hypothetical protein
LIKLLSLECVEDGYSYKSDDEVGSKKTYRLENLLMVLRDYRETLANYRIINIDFSDHPCKERLSET